MLLNSHTLCRQRAAVLQLQRQHPRRARKQHHSVIRAAPSIDASATDAAFDYDVFVIGGGSGGVRAARTAANHGERRQRQLLVPRPHASLACTGLSHTCVGTGACRCQGSAG